MATPYIEILDSEIDPDSPITTSLMFRLRDNPIAIAEGSPGAPSVSLSALGTQMFAPKETHVMVGYPFDQLDGGAVSFPAITDWFTIGRLDLGLQQYQVNHPMFGQGYWQDGLGYPDAAKFFPYWQDVAGGSEAAESDFPLHFEQPPVGATGLSTIEGWIMGFDFLFNVAGDTVIGLKLFLWVEAATLNALDNGWLEPSSLGINEFDVEDGAGWVAIGEIDAFSGVETLMEAEARINNDDVQIRFRRASYSNTPTGRDWEKSNRLSWSGVLMG